MGVQKHKWRSLEHDARKDEEKINWIFKKPRSMQIYGYDMFEPH